MPQYMYLARIGYANLNNRFKTIFNDLKTSSVGVRVLAAYSIELHVYIEVIWNDLQS